MPSFRAPLGLLLATLAAGCGGGDSDSGALPSCAEENRRVEAPADLPPELPLPEGLVLTNADSSGEGRFALRGVVRGDLEGTAGFFKERLPAEGFRLGEGDAEEHEQESEFEGHGYEGEWRVVRNPGVCPVVAVFVTLNAET